MTPTSGNLRLANDSDTTPLPGTEDTAANRPERRCTPRIPITGVATTISHDHDAFRLGKDLRLVDYCDGGLGAININPMDIGDSVCLQLPWDPTTVRKGRVIRCTERPDEDGGGYFVAIQFPMRKAA